MNRAAFFLTIAFAIPNEVARHSFAQRTGGSRSCDSKNSGEKKVRWQINSEREQQHQENQKQRRGQNPLPIFA